MQQADFCLSPGECYETIIQTMSEGVFVVDREGKIIFCNTAMEHLTGYRNDELIGKRCEMFMFCHCDSTTECILFSEQEIVKKECQIRHKSGKTIPVFKNARIKVDENNQVIGVVETLTDISELKTIQHQVEILEKKDQARIQFREMIGKGQAMQIVFKLIQVAAASNASILISGESGTGKERVASLIHQESRRKKKPLIKVNGSALSETLLESELFGHVKGAFTGAIKDKVGRFEAADKGTLFLDEISEVSPLIQLKILRFLQEKEFERVGETKTRRADVRIISATNQDLRNLIVKGLFREDLFYRLKVFPIVIPPLRDRKEDIGILIEHFIKKFNIETGKSLKGISAPAVASLLDYNWPGNVRELENAIEHAFVIREKGAIQLIDLPIEIREPVSDHGSNLSDAASLRPKVELQVNVSSQISATAEGLLAALTLHKWNKAATAKQLNISRTTLWRMMKRFQLG